LALKDAQEKHDDLLKMTPAEIAELPLARGGVVGVTIDMSSYPWQQKEMMVAGAAISAGQAVYFINDRVYPIA